MKPIPLWLTVFVYAYTALLGPIWIVGKVLSLGGQLILEFWLFLNRPGTRLVVEDFNRRKRESLDQCAK